jgi:putative radical SAM enzyme (TIGR03279 family)
VIVSAAGEPLRDVLDWQWLTDADSVVLELERDGVRGEAALSRAPGQAWGIEFADALFDGVRTCRNNCAFCFMTQLPKGLRAPLYLRDDDYRLSFLQGNFVTLTNLTDADEARILEQNLSPLYVSLHSIDPFVRARLVCAREDRGVERVEALLEGGIDLHVQVVLVPGANDGEILHQTLTWLAEREGVESVGIVPLGFTGHQTVFSESYESAEKARAVIGQVEEWREAMRERDGVSWVHLADEFYLNAGIEVPPAEHYDGYPQYENGIGIVRTLLDDASQLAGRLASSPAASGRVPVFVTGTLAGPVLRRVLRSHAPDAGAQVVEVQNRFFGGNVSVAGLLTAADIVSAIVEHAETAGSGSSTYLLPDLIFNADGVTLDDADLAEIRRRSGVEVRVVSSDAAGLLAGLAGVDVFPEPGPKE